MAPQVLRERCVMLVLVVRGDHLRLNGALEAVGRSAFPILIVVVVSAAIEVRRSLVLVRATVL